MSRYAAEEEVEDIFKSNHDDHRHFAGSMLTLYLLGKAHWPRRSQDANSYARSCFECQQIGPLRPSAGIRPTIQLRPMDTIGMDFTVPIAPTLSKGNQYIIILVNYFTHHLFADAVP